AVPEAIPHAAQVEPGLVALQRVDVGQIVGECVATGPVPCTALRAAAQCDQVVGVLMPVDEFGELEELLRIAERYQLAVRAPRADVEGAYMPRQATERIVRPEELVSAIGHVLVAEGAGAD